PRLDRLVHRVLDQWPVNDRKHLLGNGLGCRQKPGAKTRHRENRLFYAPHTLWHQFFLPASLMGNATILALVLCTTGESSGLYSETVALSNQCNAARSYAATALLNS